MMVTKRRVGCQYLQSGEARAMKALPLRYLTLLFMFFLCAQFAEAAGTGTIFGTVYDPSRAVVPGVTVVAQNEATGNEQTVTSDASGNFVFVSLRAGVYTVTVVHPGFSSYRQQGITLLVDQKLSLDIALQPGGTSQTVTVQGTPPQVDTRSGTISDVVTGKEITELPLDGRNVQQLVALQAGVEITGRSWFYNADVPQSVSFFSISGAPGNETNYILDSGDNNDFWTNIAMPTPNPDALQEFSVQTSNFTAEYGSKAGGVVNMVVKSGSNLFHGSAFEYFRNYALNTRAYFAHATDGEKRNEYGGTFGGPIIRDKLFFFGSFQGTNTSIAPAGLIAFVPTANQRAGDLSGTATATDPLTGKPFPNNVIPAQRLDPVMAKFLNQLIPLPTGPNGQLTYSQATPRDAYEGIGRVDYNLNTKDHLFASFFNQHDTGPNSGNPDNVLSWNYGISFLTKHLTVGETHTFSSTMMNQFAFSYGNILTTGGSAATGSRGFTWQSIGMQIPQLDKQPQMLYWGSPLFNFYTGSLVDLKRHDFQFADTFVKVHGPHELKFGADIIHDYFLDSGNYESSGYMQFSQIRTGNPYADMVLGLMSQFTQNNPTSIVATRNLTMFWGQDTYRVNPRLTLTLGLRYEPYTQWKAQNGMQDILAPGQQSVTYPNLPPGVLTVGDPGVPKNGINNDWKRIGPRLAVAYDPFGNGKTSIRGGYGIFYDTFSATTIHENASAPPFATDVSIFEPASFANPYLGNVNPFPAPIPASPSQPINRPLATVFAVPKNMVPPEIQQWNLTVERQLPASFLLRAAYVGSHGLDLTQNLNPNAGIYIPGTNAQGQPLSTLANVNSRRPYQGYQTINSSLPYGISNMTSMLVTVERRLTRGLETSINYTLAKSLDNAPQTSGDPHQNQIRNPLGSHDVYGPSDFDRRHNLVASVIYQIPTPFAQARAARYILGGWELTSIAAMQSGAPFTILSGGDPSLSNAPPVYADYVGGCNVNQRPAGTNQLNAWFNTSCFHDAATGTFGNLGRNTVRGPDFRNLDTGLYRVFKLHEQLNLTFRGEFYNILNHPNFAAPGATLDSPGFGEVTGTAGGLYGLGTTSDPRVIQFALRLDF
jgi:Carboxypeptidase regulatory-like domain/TonB-dependent Receptor Plug Domain